MKRLQQCLHVVRPIVYVSSCFTYGFLFVLLDLCFFLSLFNVVRINFDLSMYLPLVFLTFCLFPPLDFTIVQICVFFENLYFFTLEEWFQQIEDCRLALDIGFHLVGDNHYFAF